MTMSHKLVDILKGELDPGGTSRPASAQVKAVVDFIEEHPELAWRELRNEKGPHKVQQLWKVLANIANSIEGTRKTTNGWMKFWQDKRRSVAIKNKLLKQGKVYKPLSQLEQRILKLCSLRNKRKYKGLVQEKDDDDENMKEVCLNDKMYGNVSRISTEFDERSCNLMDTMIEAMGKQAIALSQIAQESFTKSKAMEQIAEASHRQALAIEKLATTFESITGSVYEVRNAVMGISYTMKSCYPSNTQNRQNTNNLFS